VTPCMLTEDAYEREYRERRERREREQREREHRDKLTSTASDKPIELTDKEKELEQMKVSIPATMWQTDGDGDGSGRLAGFEWGGVVVSIPATTSVSVEWRW